MLSIHPNARTTPAVRAEIARSAEPTGQLSSPGDDGARCGAALAVEGLDGLVDGDIEGVGVTERAVGQVVALQVAPGALDVVQLGRVLRQPLDREPGARGERPPARPAPVERAAVPDKDHPPIPPAP